MLPLHTCAWTGDTARLLQLVRNSPCVDLNAANECGVTALHIAALHGHKHFASALLQCEGIDASVRTKEGQSPLVFAINHGQAAVVQLLCEYDQRCWLSQYRRGVAHNGIGINERDMHGLTPLWYVVSEANERMLKDILSCARIQINKTDVRYGLSALHLAAKSKNEDITNALLAHHDLDVNSRDKFGATALHHAVVCDAVHNVRALCNYQPFVTRSVIDEAADLPVADIAGTPLAISIALKHTECTKLLLRHPRQTQDKSSAKLVPLSDDAKFEFDRIVNEVVTVTALVSDTSGSVISVHKAACDNNVDMLQVDEANVNEIEESTGKTPLHYAVAMNNYDVTVHLLSVRNARVDIIDNSGMTSALLAAYNQSWPCLLEITKNPTFNVNQTVGNEAKDITQMLQYDVRGSSLLHLCVTQPDDNPQLVDMLLAMPSLNVNAVDRNSNTALHLAVAFDNERIVSHLLTHPGIRVDVRNWHNDTAYDVAVRNARILCAHTLRQYKHHS